MARLIALIPARGGSQGVLRKNLHPLCGIPLLAWTVIPALEAAIGPVYVSTEDEEILAVATRYGAQVIVRPQELAGDMVGDLPLVRHALGTIAAGTEEVVIFLRPTSPFRLATEIRRFGEVAETAQGYSSIRSVRPAREHPQKMYRRSHGRLWPYLGLMHGANEPRQVLEPVWVPTGFLDAIRATTVAAGSMEGPSIYAWETPPDRDFDLDTPEDFKRAEDFAVKNGWMLTVLS